MSKIGKMQGWMIGLLSVEILFSCEYLPEKRFASLINPYGMASRNKSGAGLRIDIDKVSHGGHGATEGFLAVDQAFDAGLKLGFAKTK